MMTKACNKCGEILPLECFYIDRSRQDGHNLSCKTCFNAKLRTDHIRQTKRDNSKKNRLNNKNYSILQALQLEHGCYVCGEDDVDRLVFHHKIRANKTLTLGDHGSRSVDLEKLANEVSDCMVLCYNCHHKIHDELGHKEDISEKEIGVMFNE